MRAAPLLPSGRLLALAVMTALPMCLRANTTVFDSDWVILGGAEIAASGDQYLVGNGFYNYSTDNTEWDTSLASLQFFSGGDSHNTTGNHDVSYPGLNLGYRSSSGFTDNFAWGSVEVNPGNQLVNTNQGALYTRFLKLDGGVQQVANFSGNMVIYYDVADSRNGYLGGGLYKFGSGTGFVAPVGIVAYWGVNADSTWATAANWSSNVVPNFVGAQANFGPGLSGTGAPFSGPRTVTLNAARVAGKLVFSDPQSFTISTGTGGSLILQDISQPSQIVVTTGSHIISAPVSLTALGAGIDVASNSLLTLSGVVSGTSGLSKSNGGTLQLSASNTYTGATVVNGGRLIFGASEKLQGGLTVSSTGTVVLAAHQGGPGNVNVLDLSSLSLSGTNAFSALPENSGVDSPAPVPEPGAIDWLAVAAIGTMLLNCFGPARTSFLG